MNSMQTCNSVTFYFMKNKFSGIDRKCIFPKMTGAAEINVTELQVCMEFMICIYC